MCESDVLTSTKVPADDEGSRGATGIGVAAGADGSGDEAGEAAAVARADDVTAGGVGSVTAGGVGSEAEPAG
jgi:hypothetical protein